jgi:hypothetical protein
LNLSKLLLSLILSTLAASQTLAVAPVLDIVSSPADAVLAAELDIKTVPSEDRIFTRYFWVCEPSILFRRIFKLHVNLLSRNARTVEVIEVRPYLWRIDIREPGWDPGTWENAAEQDPIFHVRGKVRTDPFPYLKVQMADGSSFDLKLSDHEKADVLVFIKYWPGGIDKKDGKFYPAGTFKENKKSGNFVTLSGPLLPVEQLNSLRKYTYSESPVLMAEWFFVQSARQRNLLNDDDHGLGYYDFLKLKDRDAYFKLVRFNSRESELFGREFMAALDRSRISPQNRQFFVGRSLGGSIWGTLDTDKQKARGVALRNLKRKGKGSFEHNTEEWYAPLPNGLFATFLCDDKGVRQNVAPGDTHGLHDTSPANESTSAVLHINLGCINCHAGEVLKPFRDDIREQFSEGNYLLLGALKKKDQLDFERLFLSDIYFEMAEARRYYYRAIHLATKISKDASDLGLTPAVAMKAYSRQFYKYANDPVTLKSSARTLGVSEELWRSALVRYVKPLNLSQLGDVPLSRFLAKKPLTMTRLTWEDTYPLSYLIVSQELTVRLLEKKK